MRRRFASVASSFRIASFFCAFIFRDPGRFFEYRPPILRPRAQDQVDLALLHDGIGAATDAGIREQALDIAQPTDCLVQQVLRVSVTIDPPGHADVMPVDPELLAAIGERQRYFGEPDWLA